jgi:hypothetical protein
VHPRKTYNIQICEDRRGDSAQLIGEGERRFSTLFSVPYHYCIPVKPPVQVSIRWLDESIIRVEWEPSDCPGDETRLEVHCDGSRQKSVNVPEPICYWEGSPDIPPSEHSFIHVHAVSLSPPHVSQDFFKAPVPHPQAPGIESVDGTESVSDVLPHTWGFDADDPIPDHSVPLEGLEQSDSGSDSNDVSEYRQRNEDVEYEEPEDVDVDEIYEEALGRPPRRAKKVSTSQGLTCELTFYWFLDKGGRLSRTSSSGDGITGGRWLV